MPNIFASIETGKNTLITNQIGMDTVGHNIANLHTEGYSRQRVLQGTMYPDDIQPGQIGRGVRVERVFRVYNQFIENTLRSEKTGLAEWSIIYDSSTLVEIALHEPGEHGLSYKTTGFFNSWQDLSEYPEDYGLRSLVRNSGDDFATTYNQIISDYDSLRTETDLKVANTVTRVNDILDDIAKLNTMILSIEVAGKDPNDLKDRRDNLVTELAKKIDITVTQSSKAFVVTFGNYLLVEGDVTNKFATLVNVTNNDYLDVTFGGSVLNFDNIPKNRKGELGALLHFRDNIVPEYNDRLTEYAVTLAHNVNDEHFGGYSFNGTNTGIDFFSLYDTNIPQNYADLEVHTARTGIIRVEDMTSIETGSHHLQISATGTMSANTNGDIPVLDGTVTMNQAGVYTGTGGDYYVSIITPNAGAGDLAGLQVQLMNAGTAVGAVVNVPGGAAIANGVALGTVDGITFTADFNVAGTYSAGDRSNGLTPDMVGSLDGGAAIAVAPNANLVFTGGTNSGFTAGGTVRMIFGNSVTTGNDTITAYTNDTNLGLTTNVINDVNNIAAANMANAAGDNSNALNIVNLQFANLMNFSTQTFSQYFNKYTTDIGSDTNNAFKWKNNQSIIVDQLTEQRESVSGVNLDEELTFMLKYQRGFESAARYVTTIDGMIDVIINRMGYVGR